MKLVFSAATAALLASTAMVHAGGIERTSQSVSILFEDGKYAEFALAFADPNVSGEDPLSNPTGDMAPSYMSLSGGFKMDFGDRFSAALIFDQPYGANADYPVGSMYEGSVAELNSNAITALVGYDVSDRFMVFGGVAIQEMNATVSLPYIFNYTADAASATGIGAVAGAAFHIDEYALRVALTYRSSIATDHTTEEDSDAFAATTTTTSIATPQSLNLEFQTGLNQKTLLFGSVRWVNWSAFELAPPEFESTFGAPLVEYDNDTVGYSLGIGRKLSESFSMAATLGYEATLGTDPSVLGPTDGNFSVGIGGTYALNDTTEITAGLRYVWIGDADGPNGDFSNNNAIGGGIKISKAF